MSIDVDAEIERLNEQLKLWSKANLNIIKRLSDCERENSKLKAELALERAGHEAAKLRVESVERRLDLYYKNKREEA